jgi:predicted lipoprotein with Yx(FWY)xxD motif
MDVRARAGRIRSIVLGGTTVAMATVGCGKAHATRESEATSAPAQRLSSASARSVGRYVTDAKGRAVYMFVIDSKNFSACTDACAGAWPPLSPASAPGGDATVQAEMIGRITRSDGRAQVTYNELPIYYYLDDEQPGDIKGQGKNEFGGLWYLVSPDGQPIVPPAPTTTAPR